jgi:hypothetical protein
MSEEAVATDTDSRLTQLELKVEALSKVGQQELALRPSTCCNSCNNVAVTAETQGTPV